MAEVVAYKIVVESDLANKSVGQLKTDFKDLTDQLNRTKVGTEEYKKTLQSLGVVKGGLQDLKEQVLALNPEKTAQAFAKLGGTVASGFAAGQAAVALFGAESEDLTKVLVRVQAATALASGIQGLSGFGKALETARLAMVSFALSNPFTAIALAATALAAAIYGVVQAMDTTAQKADALKNMNNELADSFKRVTEEADLTEKQLKATGASEDEIYKNRQRARYEQLFILQDQLKNVQTQIDLGEGDLTALQKERDDLTFALKKQQAEIDIAKLEAQKSRDEEGIKRTEDNILRAEKKLEEQEKKAKKRREELAKEDQDFFQRYILDVQAENNRNEFLLAQKAAKDKMDLIAEEQDFFERYILNVSESNSRIAREEIELAKLVRDTKINLVGQTFGAIGDLAMAFAGENEEGAKRAFEINKAASIAQAIISTYQGANAIFANAAANPSTVLFPAQPFITAGLAIAAGLANVAKIAKTQFKSSDAGGSSSGVPNLTPGGGNAATPPSFQKPEGTGVNKNEQGDFVSFEKTQAQRVYVVESDISRVQSRVKVIEQNAKY